MEQQFIDGLKEALELDEERAIQMNDNFKEFDEWDSLAQLSLIAFLDEEYEVNIESDELSGVSTVRELFDLVGSKRADQ